MLSLTLNVRYLGRLGGDVVAVGRWWREAGQDEIDAVVLAGKAREAALVGEARWGRTLDARPVLKALERKAEGLPRARAPLSYALCARERVRHAAPGTLAVTAADIFPSGGPRSATASS